MPARPSSASPDATRASRCSARLAAVFWSFGAPGSFRRGHDPSAFEAAGSERYDRVLSTLPNDVMLWVAGHLLSDDYRRRLETIEYHTAVCLLLEIDRRVRFLIKRLENAEIVNSAGRDTDQVFFGASVKIKSQKGEQTVTIVGVDEVDPAHGKVSWISPIAKALLKCREGDIVTLRTPAGDEKLEILEVRYMEIE